MSSGPLNDLWYFDTADSTWTWASGSSKVNDSGLDEAKQLMNPRARCFHSMSYSLSEDLLYVHGGYTGTTSSSFRIPIHNDHRSAHAKRFLEMELSNETMEFHLW